MDTTQRLAAYLSGDLDADERTALEAELAGDPALRDRLERIRESDEALASLGDVELPDGFEQRLDATVDGVLDEVLGDELSARRARRRTLPGWVPALAAAAVAIVVGGGVVLSGLGGSDQGVNTTADTAGEAGDGMMAESSANGGGDDAAEEAPAVPGPRIVTEDREFAPADLQDLAANPELIDLIAGVPVDDQPVTVARAWAGVLGADVDDLGSLAVRSGTGPEEDQATESADRDVAGQGATGAVSDPVVRFEGEPTEEDRRDVARCLSQLYEDAAAPVVPLYAELATDEDGDDVIVYAALARDADGDYQRVEVWMLARDDCSLRQFVQHDR